MYGCLCVHARVALCVSLLHEAVWLCLCMRAFVYVRMRACVRVCPCVNKFCVAVD